MPTTSLKLPDEGCALARLIYTAKALADLERPTHFIESDAGAALETVALIEEAVNVLQRHPLIGRPVEHPLRELVISRGRSGRVALYSFEPLHDAVLILAIRHQREAGYAGDV
jgi:plasmid stabilization system protein ParE